jgi:hypothetical protein
MRKIAALLLSTVVQASSTEDFDAMHDIDLIAGVDYEVVQTT